MTSGQGQSWGYSAHIGQDVEFITDGTRFTGDRVRRLYSEKRCGGDVVVVEGEPGAAIVVAASMLDPAVCSAMETGAPRAWWRRLSIFIGCSWNIDFRRSFATTRMSSRRLAMKNPLQPIAKFKPPRQLSMALDFDKAQRNKRRRTKRDNCSLGASLGGGCRRRNRGDQR